MADESPSREEIKQLVKAGRKLEAVKLAREESGIGLKEAKDQVDEIESELIATGEMAPRAKGCVGVFLLMATGLGSFGAWLLA